MPVSFKELIPEIAKQLNARKGLMFSRSIYIMWPMVIVVGLLGVTIWFCKTYLPSNTGANAIIASVFMLFAIYAVLHIYVARSIFTFEKKIWIDSFFNQINLDPKQSWAIAKKMFWPVLEFRLYIFAKYYLLPLLIYFLSLALWVALAAQYGSQIPWWTLPLILLGFPIIIWIYDRYYIGIKLRFSWFVFLDKYTPNDFTYKQLLLEMKKLNDSSKTDSTKKSIQSLMGVDLLSLGEGVFNTAALGVAKQLGPLGKVIGGLAAPVLQESEAEVNDFIQTMTFYILYRAACLSLYGSYQKANDYIYGLRS